MNIGIDIDDVITDGEAYYAYAQKYTIDVLKREPVIINDEGLCDNASYCSELLGWTQEEADDFWDNNMGNVISTGNLRFFAKETISKLRQEGHKIILITARHKKEMEYGYPWLEKHGIEYDDLILDAKEKGKIAKENNIGIFIDDSFCNCIDTTNQGITTYIMDLRTNRNINLQGTGIKRIFSWPHFYEEIKKKGV